MTWRDGAHLTGTPIWCDARRRRDVCFVSSADRVGRAGHGQLIATPLTLALLGARGDGHLGVPLHRRFTLGTVRLELVASGHGPGAAALLVDIAGNTVLYAGAVRSLRDASPPIEAAEVRACNAVVVAAPYGDPRQRFPPLADTIARTTAWVEKMLAAGRHAVLLVDSALDGLEVATCLHAAGIPLAGGRSIREVARRAGGLLSIGPRAALHGDAARRAGEPQPLANGSSRPPEPRGDASARIAGGAILEDLARAELAIASPGREPRAVIWLAADRPGLARALGERPYTTALVSGRALAGADVGFAWSNVADHEHLLEWIEATNAREVFVTGAGAEAIAAALGPRARVIGPPQQMTLFPREAAP